MSNEIVKSEVGEVLKLDDLTLTKEDVKKHFTPGATDDELAVFIMTANAWGLNPIKKEIMFVKYGSNPGTSVINYQVPIKRAEASGELEGFTVDYHGQGDNAICTVTIHRKGWKTPFVHETVYREVAYGYRKDGGKYHKSAGWKAQPTFMHKKTSINQAFKLAFPSLLGNMPYIEGEVPMAGDTVEADYEVVKDPINPKERISAVNDSDLPWQDDETALSMLELFMQGHFAHDRGAAKDMLKRCFGTSAWTKIKKLPEDEIQRGYEEMKRLLDGEDVNQPDDEPQREEAGEEQTDVSEQPSSTKNKGGDPLPESELAGSPPANLKAARAIFNNSTHSKKDVERVADLLGYSLTDDSANISGNMDNKEYKVAIQGIIGWYELREV